MNQVVIGLGSNIDPSENITQARKKIASHFKVIKESTFIQTAPIGYTDQDDFVNGSIHIETEFEHEELKTALRTMEDDLGRKRSDIKFGPRSIDLDIVVFNRKIVDNDFYTRDFLKNSVLELIPDLEY